MSQFTEALVDDQNEKLWRLKKKYQVRWTEKNGLVMSEVRVKWEDWFKNAERQLLRWC